MTSKTKIRLLIIVPVLLLFAFGGWYGTNWLCAGRADLFAMIEIGDRDSVRWVLCWRPEMLEARGMFDRTLVDAAIDYEDVEILLILIEAGADVSLRDGRGLTPIHRATTREIAQLLIEHGARIDNLAKDGESVLHTAASFGRTDVIKLLLQKGMDPNVKDKVGRTPLHYAVNAGSNWRPLETVRMLLDAGVKVNTQDLHNYETALDYAHRDNMVEVQKVLTDAGGKRGVLPE